MCTLYPEHLPNDAVDYIPEYGEWHHPDSIIRVLGETPEIKYWVMGLEQGDECRHAHYHLYAELSAPQRITYWQRTIGTQHHYEAAKSTQQQCYDYINHSGAHADKPGVKLSGTYTGGTKLKAIKEHGDPYDRAIDMVLRGDDIITIIRTIGGSILPQTGNLCRLIEILNRADRRESIETGKTILLDAYRRQLNKADNKIAAMQEWIDVIHTH